jgi:hypothetical protein
MPAGFWRTREGERMTTFETPTVTTERLRLRAFETGDLDAYATMQVNPEVMRYLITGCVAACDAF